MARTSRQKPIRSAPAVFAWLERSRAQAFRARPVRPPADQDAAAVLAELPQLGLLIRDAELRGVLGAACRAQAAVVASGLLDRDRADQPGQRDVQPHAVELLVRRVAVKPRQASDRDRPVEAEFVPGADRLERRLLVENRAVAPGYSSFGPNLLLRLRIGSKAAVSRPRDRRTGWRYAAPGAGGGRYRRLLAVGAVDSRFK